jgi:hypothetical protein
MENNINMGFKEFGLEGINWTGLDWSGLFEETVQCAVIQAVLNFWVL